MDGEVGVLVIGTNGWLQVQGGDKGGGKTRGRRFLAVEDKNIMAEVWQHAVLLSIIATWKETSLTDY